MKNIYNVTLYRPDDISSLKSIWNSLESGADMTYFQTYNWYEMLSKSRSIQNKYIDIIIGVVNRNDKPILIAPLLIIKRTYRIINKQGIYFWGKKTFSDYLNLIYNEYDSDSVIFLLKYLYSIYRVNYCRFEQVRSDTSFYRHLTSELCASPVLKTTCVGLELPQRSEEYYKLLSKHSRQNIRTAFNRMKKDGVKLDFVFDDKFVDKEVCFNMRQERVIAKQKNCYDRKSIYVKFKSVIKDFLEFHFPEPQPPFCKDKDSKMLSAYDGDVLCAFFNYGVDKYHKRVVLMSVGLNEQYSRYSVGLITLYNFITHLIDVGEMKYFDFTRGCEHYKYALGGADFLIYDFELSFSSFS